MPPHEMPQNGGYMVAAYLFTAILLGGYWLRMWIRVTREVGKQAETLGGRVL